MATYPIKMLRDEDRQAFVPFTNAAAVVDKDNKSLQELMDSGKYKIQNNVTTSSAGKGVLDAYQGKVLNDKFNNYVPLSQKGVANGVASLDAEGKVPSAQLPSYVDDVIESYIVSGSTALSAGWLSKTNGGTALTPEKGKIYLIMTSGAYQNKQYRWGGSTYVLCNPSDVNSVNGMTGVVTLKKLTIQKNGTQVGDTFNGTTDEIINITVPTNNNQLTNGAGYITSAGSITGNAATATKATQDSSGNVIVDTYVKKAGDTMTGTLTVEGNVQVPAGYVKGDISDYRNHAIKLGHSGDNVMNFYEYGGEFGFYKSQSNTDTLLGKITNQGWVGNVVGNVTGNATSATKATQDGNGKVIASTYLPLAGGTMTGAITVHGLVGQKITDYDADNLTNGIYHTDTDANSKTIANLPTQQSMGIIVITPYNSGTDNRTVQLGLSSNNNLYFRSLRADSNSTKAWQTVVTSANSTNYKSGGTKAALTIQKNGTTVKTFDGSAAVTANITVPTKTSELTNDSNYVKNTTYASASTAGVVKLGTGLAIADGVLSVTGAATADSVEWSVVKNRPTAVSYWTNDAGYIKASNTMKGATSTTAGSAGTVPAPAAGKEAQFLRGDGTWAVPSYATSAGSATTATKATQDGNGKVIATTYLPLAGGTMAGPIKWPNGTALPQSSDLQYIVGIDAFADGGTMKWTSIGDLKASKDGSGNVITSTYVKKAGDTVSGTLTCSTSSFGTALVVQRQGSTNAAAIQFKNDNGTLGYICMGAVDGGLIRYNAAVSKNYTFLDTGNYTTHLNSVYVNVTGDTMTGALNLANSVANKVGDDVKIGDYNKGGRLGIQGQNGNTGITLLEYGGAWEASTPSVSMVYNHTNKCLEFVFV